MAALVAACVAAGTAAAQTIDVTRVLKEQADIDRRIDEACDRVCAGNESRGWLQDAQLQIRPDQPTSALVAAVRLRSQHRPFRGGPVLYSDTANVRVRAEIDNSSCRIVDIDVSSSNEIYKHILLPLFRDRIEASASRLSLPC